MSKYTPGPWFVQQPNDAAENSTLYYKTLLVKPIPGQVVCECDPLPELEANANLIAAAPELYEIAQAIVDTLNDWEIERFKNGNATFLSKGIDAAIFTKAVAALAKANGES